MRRYTVNLYRASGVEPVEAELCLPAITEKINQTDSQTDDFTNLFINLLNTLFCSCGLKDNYSNAYMAN